MAYSCGTFINIVDNNAKSWESQLVQIRGLGERDHIEVWLEWSPDAGATATLIDILKDENVIVHAPFVGLSLVTPWSDLRKISIYRLEGVVDLAHQLGASMLTVHPGSAVIAEPRNRLLDRLAESYEHLEKHAKPLIIALENMPDRRTATQEGVVSTREFQLLLNRVPAMKFTLDVGHALQNGDLYEEFLRGCSGSIANIHLHDGIEGGPGHLALGEGQLKLKEFLQALKATKYGSYLTLETLGWTDTSTSWKKLLDVHAELDPR